MEISVRQIKDVHIFDIDGNVNEIGGFEKIKSVINFSVKQDLKNVAVNLSNVTFINSSGIGLLTTWHNELAKIGGDLYLVEPSQHIEEILRLLRVDKIIDIYHMESHLLEKLG